LATHRPHPTHTTTRPPQQETSGPLGHTQQANPPGTPRRPAAPSTGDRRGACRTGTRPHPQTTPTNCKLQKPTHQPDPAKPGRPAGQRLKMLASTVQFSTYEQTPPAAPRQTTHHRDQPGTGERGTRQPEALHPDPKTRDQKGGQQPAPSGPNSVPTTGPPRPPAFPTPTPPRGRRRRTSDTTSTTGRTGQRSTLEHHPDTPRPDRMWPGRPVLAWLCAGHPTRGHQRDAP
jgi:hypothetical protein